MEVSTTFFVFAIIALLAQGLLLFLALFEPAIPYKITKAPKAPLDSDQFLRVLESVADAHVFGNTKVEVFTNGEQFYEAELEALRKAKHSIHLEAYIFQKGEVTRRFLEVMTERARQGVEVRLALDSIGSFSTWSSYFKDLQAAGGQVAWYHPIRWHTLPKLNNRTHRELIIIDGTIGFTGGAGFADHWLISRPGHPRWRDTMCRVEGEVVTGMQATFIENWLESSGQLLACEEIFPSCKVEQGCAAMMINSSPTAGGTTRARMLFQTLLASARQSIHITTPYFLPDYSARKEMIRAIKQRGVDVRIIVPGRNSDHLLTRRSSRRLYGDLLKAGAKIYEYNPSMIHAKTLVIDGQWSVVGSTNFDHRSFGLNDEVNLAARDERLAQRLLADFAHDAAHSRLVSYREWRRRPFYERLHELFGWVLERQQ